MRDLRAVICDMDGLLVDSEPLYKQAWQDAASEVGFDLPDPVYMSFIGMTEPDCEEVLVRHFGGSFPLPEFRDEWRKRWFEVVEAGELLPKPGAHDLLHALRRTESRLAVATSSARRYATLSLERTGLEPYFEQVVTAEDATRGKPAPDLYQTAASRLGIDPGRCLVLEDSPTGTEAGLAAGMSVIVVPDLQPPPADCVARVAGVFSSLLEATPVVLRAVTRD